MNIVRSCPLHSIPWAKHTVWNKWITMTINVKSKCQFKQVGRWFLQIIDIGNFNMKLSGRWFPHIVDSGNIYPIYIYII